MSKLERYFAKEADRWKARAEKAEASERAALYTVEKLERERDEAQAQARTAWTAAKHAGEERDEAYESAHRIEVAYDEALAVSASSPSSVWKGGEE